MYARVSRQGGIAAGNANAEVTATEQTRVAICENASSPRPQSIFGPAEKVGCVERSVVEVTLKHGLSDRVGLLSGDAPRLACGSAGEPNDSD